MRIISGTWKGKSIKVPNEGTRPSTDRTRQALFNMLQHVIEDATVLDLYAGSGALSLECLSRGATKAVAVDTDRIACMTIKQNARALGCETISVLQRPVLDHLAKGARYDTFSLVFADPPYENDFSTSELKKVLTHENLESLLSPEAFFIAESPKEISPKELESLPDYWKVIAQRSYGKSFITILKRTSE